MYRKNVKRMKKIKNWLAQIFSVFCTEFRLLSRDQGVILFFAFLPIAYPIIYSLIYNPELVRDVKFVVVDHDRTAASRELVRELDACQEARSIGYAPDLSEARHAMNSHKCYAILEIPAGFGRKTASMQQAQAVMYCEMSLLLRYRGFVVATTNVAQNMGAEIQHAAANEYIPVAETLVTGDPLPVESVMLGNTEAGFDSFIMPAVLILILHQCIVLAVGMMGGAAHESPRKTGYYPLNEARSVSATMIGKTLCYYLILAVPQIFLVHYVPVIFSFPVEGSIWQIQAFLLPMILACIALGFSLQPFVREREAIFVIWVITSVFLLFLSGITWPRFAMPEVWKWLGDIIPATWGVEGFVKISTNGATISQVGGCYTMLWILAAAYFILAWVLHKFVMRKQIARNLARGLYNC